MRRLLLKLKSLFKKDAPVPRLHRAQHKFRARYPHYEIGIGSYGMPSVHDWNEGSTLRIGAYCSIGGNVQIYLGGHHRSDWVSSFPFPAFVEEAAGIPDHGRTRGDVVIGSDVWVCSNVIILSGITIGHGAVVANGSVVTSDVAPYSMVAGNPARHVRWRFPEEVRKALLEVAWWNWPEAEIRQITPLLCSSKVTDITHYAARRSARDSRP